MTRFVYSLSTGLHVHDAQTGLRAFSEELAPALWSIAGERYEYEMNVLLECSAAVFTAGFVLARRMDILAVSHGSYGRMERGKGVNL